MIVVAVYSVSQIRVFEEFIRRLPPQEHVCVLSFCDSAIVNDQLAQVAQGLQIEFDTVASLSERITPAQVAKELRATPFRSFEKKVPLNKSYCDLLARQRAACRSYINAKSIELVLVCEDGPGGCGPLIAIAKDQDIPVIDMPFGIGEMRDYRMFLENRAKQGLLNLVPDGPVGAALREHASHWILQTEFGDLTLFPADFVLARIATGLDLPRPWVAHGGEADMLCVESDAMERIYARENVDPAKRVMTGSCYADVVYDEVFSNASLREAYDTCRLIDADKPRILVALPPSYHGERPAEFPTYEETVERLLKGCRAAHPRSVITVSIHPAADHATREIVKKYADSISDDWILRLIARNDVFVPVFSSTTRWALMARKPIVNYDLYNFDLPTYDTAPVVFNTTNLSKALEHLAQKLESPDSYHLAATEVSRLADEWGIMDGKNFERIWQQVESLRKSQRRITNRSASRFGLSRLAQVLGIRK